MTGRQQAAALILAAVMCGVSPAEPPRDGPGGRTQGPRPPAEPGPDGDAPPGDDLGPACPCHPGAERVIPRLPITPQECFDQWRHALIQGNRDAIWNLLTQSSRDALEADAEALCTAENPEATARALGVTVEALRESDHRDVAIGLILAAVTTERIRELLETSLKGVRMSGDAASARLVRGDSSEPIYFTRARVIDGWKVDWVRTRAAAEDARK